MAGRAVCEVTRQDNLGTVHVGSVQLLWCVCVVACVCGEFQCHVEHAKELLDTIYRNMAKGGVNVRLGKLKEHCRRMKAVWLHIYIYIYMCTCLYTCVAVSRTEAWDAPPSSTVGLPPHRYYVYSGVSGLHSKVVISVAGVRLVSMWLYAFVWPIRKPCSGRNKHLGAHFEDCER